MLHAFEHFIFCFKAAVFEPADDTTTAKPKTNFQHHENNAHRIEIKSGESLRIKHKLQKLDDEHTDEALP